MLGIIQQSLTTFILGFILFFVGKGSDLLDSDRLRALLISPLSVLQLNRLCIATQHTPLAVVEVLSSLYPLFFHRPCVFPPGCATETSLLHLLEGICSSDTKKHLPHVHWRPEEIGHPDSAAECPS